MRILIVGMTESIHTVRWVSQIADQGWTVCLFPSIDCGVIHPDFSNVRLCVPLYGRKPLNKSAKISGISVFNDYLARGMNHIFTKAAFYERYRAERLARIIQKMKPDAVHSIEIQHAGYLTLEARKRFRGTFPPWIVTNWGSDIYLFGRLAQHEPRIREVLAACDYYSCECQRDVDLAKAYGFMGTILPVFPNTGGFDIATAEHLRQPGAVSARRLILLKGYQHWAGRALFGLRALERCADALQGYELAIFSASPDVTIAAKLFEQTTGIPTTLVPKGTPHKEILRLHGRARISLALSISDAISTSLIEAMVMGSFPIQSWTACADEWIRDGTSGFLVPPEDPDVVEQAIRRALDDDCLVDNAAIENWRVAVERLDHFVIKSRTIDFYKAVTQRSGQISFT